MIKLQRLFINHKAAGTIQLTQDNIAVDVGNNTHKGRLITVKLIHTRIYRTGPIPAIIITTPTKVEMIVIVRIITVTHKSMSTATRSTSAIHHRKVSTDILLQQVIPLFIAKICFHRIAKIRAETKEINQTRTGIKIKSTTFIGSVRHIGRYSAVIHQRGHRIFFSRSAVFGKRVRHIGIIIICTVVVDRQSTVIAVIAMDTATVLRILMIIDNLRHGSSHTTCQCVSTRTAGVFRTKGIVIRGLIPFGT